MGLREIDTVMQGLGFARGKGGHVSRAREAETEMKSATGCSRRAERFARGEHRDPGIYRPSEY
jgi:hypothetical protein